VLHIDYDGTGDSAGSDRDPGRAEAWQGSVRAAVDLLRRGGARKVCVVGMRLGATVAACASEGCGLDALVLWDPCDSGRSYLREEALLRSVYLGDQGLDIPPDPAVSGAGGTEVLGTVYDAATVRAMTQLTLESAQGDLADHVLALLRPERPPRRATLERLSLAHAETADAQGQEELISVWPLKSVVPQGTLDTIVAWLSGVTGPESSPIVVPGTSDAALECPDGGEVVEEIRYMGPNRLFGILTRPPGPRPDATVVMLNSGRVDHVGPGRLWVDLARSWARDGIGVWRVDLSGLGNSPARAGRNPGVVYSPEALDDIADIASAVSPRSSSAVVLMGLCSGAYHAVQTARTAGALGVLAINLIFPTGEAQPQGEAPSGRPSRPGLVVRAAAALRRSAKHLPGHHFLGATARRLADVKSWLVHRTTGEVPPAFVLREVAGLGARVFVLCGSYEGRLVRQGEAGLLRRLQKTAEFRMAVLPDIDHSLYTQGTRKQVLPLLTEQVRLLTAPQAPRPSARPGPRWPGQSQLDGQPRTPVGAT
jgi:dienelactone hydrolase